MKLGKHIPVELLDDDRLANIERRIVAHARVPAAPLRRPLALLGAFVAVAAAAALLAWSWRRSPAPPAVALLEDRVAPQHLAVTAQAERSTLALDDATLVSDPETRFDLTREPSRVVIEMTRGRIELAVKHRTGRVLVVRAGDTEIEDVGTRFSVAYDGTTVDVRVTEGEVRVTRDHHETRVTAGNAWTTSRGLVALAELAPPPVAPAPVPSLPGHVAIAPPPSAPIVAVAHVPAYRHVAAAAPPSTPRAEHAAAAPADPYLDLKKAIRAQPIAFDPKIDGKADAANEITRLKHLAYSPTTVGAEASAALYRIAVLLHRPLGQDTAALDTLELYRRRFTSGRERTAAMWLRLRIACGRALDEECRSAAYSYQREAPPGAAADVAVRITNAQ